MGKQRWRTTTGQRHSHVQLSCRPVHPGKIPPQFSHAWDRVSSSLRLNDVTTARIGVCELLVLIDTGEGKSALEIS
jgi:hypothetical protein